MTKYTSLNLVHLTVSPPEPETPQSTRCSGPPTPYTPTSLVALVTDSPHTYPAMSQLNWRSAVLLCFMIVHHEIIVATNHISRHHEFLTNRRSKIDDQMVYDSLGPIYIGHDWASFHDDTDEYRDDDLYSRSLHPSKTSNLTRSLQRTEGGRRRLFGMILLLVSLVTTFASVGVDAYVSVNGCKGLYPSLKTFEDEFEAKKRDLEMKADVIDKKQEEARAMKQRVEDASDAMGGIWEEIERISRLQEEILQALDPDILVIMNTRAAIIAKEVSSTKNAAQEWSVEKIDAKFEGIFSSAETIVATFAPPLASVMEPIAKVSFKYYKMSKITSTLKASNAKQILQAAPKAKQLLGFTDDVIKANLRASTGLKVLSRSAGTVKALKFLKGAGAVLSIVGIGLDIFSIVSTVLECRDRRDKAKESLGKLKEAEKEAVLAKEEVEAYRKEVNEFWKEEVCTKVRSESLKQALRGVKELVKGAISQTSESTQTLSHIDQFLEQIDKAKPARASTLLKNLFAGLADVEFTMNCYSNKFKIIGYVVNGCKLGAAALEELYRLGTKLFPATNSEECKTKSGLVYTSYEDIANIVEKSAANQGFEAKCPLNKPEIKDVVCMKKADGVSTKKIAEELKISESDVTNIAKKCSQELTPREKTIVCNLKETTDWSDDKIAETLKLKVKAVESVSCKRKQ